MQRPRRNSAVRSRYLGADLIVNLDDEIGYEIALNRFKWRELTLMLDACKRINPEVFVDVGANLGVYSCVLGRHKAVPRIIAFEPDRANFARLAANVKLNRLGAAIETHEIALGAKNGNVALSPAGPSNRGASKIAFAADESAYDVRICPLDDVLRIDGGRIAVKINAEGSALEALMGGAQLFTRNAGYAQISGHSNQVAGVITELMAAFGWHVVERVGHDLRFEKA
jgi:FkbM family methyltransferase